VTVVSNQIDELPYENNEATASLDSFASLSNGDFRPAVKLSDSGPSISSNITTKDLFGDEVLVVNNSSIVIDEADQLSRSTTFVVFRILSLLSIKELCNVQRVSHFWYLVANENEIWRSVVVRDSRTWEPSSKGMAIALLRTSPSSSIKWKKFVREECGVQACAKCKRPFQKCRNSALACKYHPQGRELIEDKIGAPSGVYWTCCLNPSRTSPGCVVGFHSLYDWNKELKPRRAKTLDEGRRRESVG